jgi:hypothetical protein
MKAFRGRDTPRLAWKRRSYRLLRQVAPCADRQEATGHRFEGGAGVVRKFFDDEQFNFEFQFALGGVHYGPGDLGERRCRPPIASSTVTRTVGAGSGSQPDSAWRR